MKFLANVLLVMLLALPLMGQTVTQLEYFFNSDPGFGNGTSISVTEVDGEVTYEGSIITSSLSRGLHTLFIRAKNSDDEWGLTIKKLILVDQGEVREIEAMEYFFDEDPGHGNGTNISVDEASDINLETMLSTTGLDIGVHTVSIRAKFKDGNWGMPIKKLILIDRSDPATVSEIVAAEYFFNTDPGFAEAIPISIDSGTEIESTFTIPSSNLPIGDQNLYVRVQDSDGVWSMYSASTVALSEVASISFNNSDTLKYYTDTGKLSFFDDLGISSSTEITADSAIISFTDGFIFEDDSLGLENDGSLDHTISDEKVILSGNGSLSDYQEALKTVFYTRKKASVYRDTLKEISLTVYSGSLASESIKKYIHIQEVDSMGTAVEDEPDHPFEFSLDQNYPNPFNPSTTINFAIPRSVEVKLDVYNLLGQKVAQLIDGKLSAGNHSARFEATSLSSGLYIYRLQAGSFVQTKRMMLIK